MPSTLFATSKYFGIGNRIDADTVEEAVEQAGMDWKVSKHELISKSIDPNFNGLPLSRHVSIIREDTRTVVGVLGNGYECIQNIEAMKMFESILADGEITFEHGGQLDGGRRLWVVAKLPNPLKVGPNLIEKNIVISWSHSGEMAISAFFTPYLYRRGRHIALTAPIRGVPMSVSIKHTKHALSRMKIAGETLRKSRLYFQEVADIFIDMVGTPFHTSSMDNYLHLLFPDKELVRTSTGKERVNQNVRKREEVMELFNQDHSVSGTKWAALTAIAEWTDHERTGRITQGSDKNELRLDGIWTGSAANFKSKAFKTLLEEV